VLSGNPPQERGSITAGPRAASWSCLVSTLLTEEKLEEMMEWLFGYDAMTIAEPLRAAGRLRPAMRAAFASAVMHYDARLKAKMCVPVAKRLRVMMVRFHRATNEDAAHTALTAWGEQLKAAFTTDNLHMVQWKASAGGAQFLAATQSTLQQVMERMPQVELLPEMERKQAELSNAVAMLSMRVETLTQQLMQAQAQQAQWQQQHMQLMQQHMQLMQQVSNSQPLDTMPSVQPAAAGAATTGSPAAVAAGSPPAAVAAGSPQEAAGVCPRTGWVTYAKTG